ncbi:MAG: NUDIX domain-containing protein [Clostridia bacterium]|nr:NUDIX domain-containing protein [Clostridia bacterium]
MYCIKTLIDEDFNLKSIPMDNPRIRLGARGIVLNDKNEIAILNKINKNEYKLIGGGIEDNEEPEQAFKREVLEESGCEIEIAKCLGTIEELKSQDNFKQTSFVYVGKVINDTKKLHLTNKEQEEGSKLLWMKLDQAIEAIKDSEKKLIASKYESVYHTKFIVRRDYEILKYYKNKYEK